jgi:ATP/maltotriose-dependent transcriptional regulator MalT
MVAGGSEVLAYAAEALVLHGDLDGAEQQLAQGLEIVERYGERIYLPQLLLIQGAVARARGQLAAADASMRRALEESRAQEAPWLTLLALTELCAGSRAKSADVRALGALVSELGEAGDTPAYQRARVLLDRARN